MPGVKSGLDDALRVLKNVEDIGICQLTSKDVVRHPLVQQIVKAYELDEKRKERKNNAKERADRRR
jgi:phosphate starvation-inducible PhoH-like protein